MGYIAFDDELGSVTVSNGLTLPARRFSNWTPDVNRIADRRVALGSGITYEYLYRTDYTAAFQIEHYPVVRLASFIRFKEWAMRGCEFFVHTEDEANRVYLCRIAPGTEPKAEMSNREMLEYTLTIDAMSADDPVEFMACIYRS